jgi:hypothetical protein
MYRSKTMFIAFALAATVCGQVEPGAGKWQTWVLSSGNQMRLPAFPDDNATIAELAWLKSFMSNTNDVARAQMEYWDAGSPGYRWIKIASDEMIRRNVPATLYTRDMALVSAAIYDATIAAWDSKYIWKRPRPSERDGTIVPRLAAIVSGWPTIRPKPLHTFR